MDSDKKLSPLYITPNARSAFMTKMNIKIEHDRRELEPIDLDTDITFFNNEKATEVVSAYDQFFMYTKTFPLFDERKQRENRQYQPDIWECIYQQEKHKAIPATTSLNYGWRPIYDIVEGTNKRQDVISGFYRKKGMPTDKEVAKFSEAPKEFII